MNINNRIRDKRSKLEIIFLCVIFGVFFLRVINLDADIVPWDMGHFQPIDEAYYTKAAFNWYNSATYLNQPDILENIKQSSQAGQSFITNVFVYISLLIFKNTYYGLRMSAVFSAGVILILSYFIMNKLDEKSNCKSGIILKYGLLLYLVTDFAFLISSRVLEPVLIRGMWVVLTIFLLMYIEKNEKLKIFILGFMTVTGIFLVYLINAFMLFPSGILFLMYLFYDRKNLIRLTISYIAGAVVGLVISDVVLRVLNGQSLIAFIGGVNSAAGSRVTFSFEAVKMNFLEILKSNIFMYNPIILTISIISIIGGVYLIFKKKDKNIAYILSTVVGFIIYSSLTSDYVYKKFTLILPILLLCIYICSINIKEFKGILSKWVYCFGVVAIYVITYCLTVEVILTRFNNISELGNTMIKAYKALIIIVPIVFLISMILYFKADMKKNIFLIMAIIVCIMSNALFSLRYIYFFNNYSEKNIMVDVGKIVGKEMMIGGFPHGYRLYNETIPVLSGYDTYISQEFYESRLIDLVNKENVNYYIGYYSNGSTVEDINSIIKNTEYKFEMVKVYQRYLEENDDMVLLKKVKK